MLKYLIGAIILIAIIISFFSGILVDRYYLVEPIEITDEKHEETKWQNSQLKQKIENKEELTTENNLVIADCYIKPILIVGAVKDDTLYVEAGDGCKSARSEFTIRARETKHHILQAGIIFQYQKTFAYELSYLYDFGILAIGGGIIIDRENPGVKLVVQKSF